MNVIVFSKPAKSIDFIPKLCKNCTYFVSKGNIFHDYCTKFKTNTLYSRTTGKCGPEGKHFEFKGWLK